MGEPVWTSILVGGKATRATWEELAAMCPDDEQDELEWCAQNHSPFESHGMVTNANTEDVRDFCRQHGLSYRVNDQGCRSYDEGPGQISWRPGMKDEKGVTTDPGYDPYITLSDLKAAVVAGCTVAEIIGELSAGEFEIPPMEITDGSATSGATIV